jgi:hypothetical protein
MSFALKWHMGKTRLVLLADFGETYFLLHILPNSTARILACFTLAMECFDSEGSLSFGEVGSLSSEHGAAVRLIRPRSRVAYSIEWNCDSTFHFAVLYAVYMLRMWLSGADMPDTFRPSYQANRSSK